MILCVSNCFDVFRWKLIGPSILQGPPKGLPRASLPLHTDQTLGAKLGAPGSPHPPSHGIVLLASQEPWRSNHSNRWNFDVKSSSKFMTWCSKCFSDHQCHQWSWCIYQLLLESLYTCECLVLRFRQCCRASVCDFEVCLRQLGMQHVLLQGTNQFILTKCSRW